MHAWSGWGAWDEVRSGLNDMSATIDMLQIIELTHIWYIWLWRLRTITLEYGMDILCWLSSFMTSVARLKPSVDNCNWIPLVCCHIMDCHTVDCCLPTWIDHWIVAIVRRRADAAIVWCCELAWSSREEGVLRTSPWCKLSPASTGVTVVEWLDKHYKSWIRDYNHINGAPTGTQVKIGPKHSTACRTGRLNWILGLCSAKYVSSY